MKRAQAGRVSRRIATEPEQAQLFSPRHRSPLAMMAATPEEWQVLLTRSLAFACDFVLANHGTALDLLEALEANFGLGVRMLIGEIVARLENHPDLNALDREYVESALNAAALDRVTRGARAKEGEDHSVDDLLARRAAVSGPGVCTAAIEFAATHPELAPYNTLLVFVQRPSATRWSTADEWRRQGRAVRADAVPIVLLRAAGPIMLAYDVADTTGPESPAASASVAPAFDPQRLERTIAAAERDGIRIGLSATSHHSHRGRGALPAPSVLIPLDAGRSVAEQYAKLCERLAHVLLGHLGSDAEGRWPSRIALTWVPKLAEARAATQVVLRRAGLGEEAPCDLVQLFEPAVCAHISLDLTMKVAGRIERYGAVEG